MNATVSKRESTRDMLILTIWVWIICPVDKLHTAGVKNGEPEGLARQETNETHGGK